MDRAVARSFALLECLARAGEPMRLADICRRVGLQKSTAHRILHSLIDLGYAAQDSAGRYLATLRTWELGAELAAKHPIKRAAAGFLLGLHRITGETVSLTVLSGTDVVYLDKIVAPRPVRFMTRVGSRAPAAFTAGGKAILAARADRADLIADIATRHPLDIFALQVELEEARGRGYARSGHSPGVVSIGVAVAIGDAPAEAALSVSAPVDRMTTAAQEAAIDALLETGARMSEALSSR